jgi:hypothetical protein
MVRILLLADVCRKVKSGEGTKGNLNDSPEMLVMFVSIKNRNSISDHR